MNRTEKGNNAKHFLKAATRRDVWLMLHFLLDVFYILVDISNTFQERAAVLSDILSQINLVAKSLHKFKTWYECLTFSALLCCMSNANFVFYLSSIYSFYINLKAPITTAAEDKFCNIIPSFQQK